MNPFEAQLKLGNRTMAEANNESAPFSNDNPLGRIGPDVPVPHCERVSVEVFLHDMAEIHRQRVMRQSQNAQKATP